MCLLERLRENDFRFSVPHDYCNLSVILDDDWINDVEAMVDLNRKHFMRQWAYWKVIIPNPFLFDISVFLYCFSSTVVFVTNKRIYFAHFRK